MGLGGLCEALQPEGGWGAGVGGLRGLLRSRGAPGAREVFGGSSAAGRRIVPEGVCWGALVLGGVQGAMQGPGPFGRGESRGDPVAKVYFVGMLWSGILGEGGMVLSPG